MPILLFGITTTIGFVIICGLLCCLTFAIMFTVACGDCAWVVWRVVFRFVAIIIGNILAFLAFLPIILIILVVLLITYFMFLGGSSAFSIISTIGFTIQVFLSGVVAVLNPLSLLYPAIMTFVNLILKIVFLIAEGAFYVFCPGVLLSDDGFNAFSDCPILVLFIPTAQGLTNLILTTIEIIRIIFGLIALALFPTICLRDLTCEKMCLELGLGLGCPYNFSNALKWLFMTQSGVPVNIIEFAINLVDLLTSFWLLPLLNWIFAQSYTTSLVGLSSLYEIFFVIGASSGTKLSKVVVGLIVNFILCIPDWLYCTLFTGNIGPCFSRNICIIILGLIPWPFPPFSLTYVCPAPETCPCSTCISGWLGFLVPCSTHPSCNSSCSIFNSFLPGLIFWWRSL